MAGEASSIVDLISNAGLVGLLVLIIVGGAKRMWVFGWVYENALAEKDEWKELALSGTTVAEKAVSAAEVATSTVTPTPKRTRRPTN